MSLPRDLLEQAAHLANREPQRPRQASLRRALSSAYYALFHLLIEDAAINAAPSMPAGLRELVQRALSHNEMRNVCKGFVAGHEAFLKRRADNRPFQHGEPPPSTQTLLDFPLDRDLIEVMTAFVEAQEARHSADYDVRSVWNRVDVLTRIKAVRSAFDAWGRVRSTPNAAVFKSALLLQSRWGR